MYYTHEKMLAAIAELKKGARFCNSCGCVFHTRASAWVQPNCEKCGDEENCEYCCLCGSVLEASRVDYAFRRGGRCLNCYSCSKGITDACSFCRVKHPERWRCQQPASLSPTPE